MGATIAVEVKGDERLRDLIPRLGPLAREAEKNTSQRAAIEMTAVLADRVRSDFRKRTGALGDSVGFSSTREVGGGFETSAGFRDGPVAAYAAVQEFGKANITPKNAKLLSIPVGEALTGTGVPRYGSPLDVPDSLDPTWIFPKGRNPLFVTRDENDEIDEVLFVGVKSVSIEGRHPVEKSFDEVSPRLPVIGQEEFDRAIAAALGG